MIQSAKPGHRRRIWLWVAALTAFVLVLIGGLGWIAWQVIDNIDAPGAPPTGSGPCGSSDSVNVQRVFADRHTGQARAHHRPRCPNPTIPRTGNTQASPAAQFGPLNPPPHPARP